MPPARPLVTCAIVVACSATAATGCGAFDVTNDSVATDADGGTAGDGATRADGPGSTGEAGTDGGGTEPADADLDAPLDDGGAVADGAITPFDAKCYGNETPEVETNDVEGMATPFTRAACGEVLVGDTDWFTIDLAGTGPLNVGFNTTGDAVLTVRRLGTGDSVQGAQPGGGYRFVSFPLLSSPGTYLFRFASATTAQKYRLVVTH